MKLFRRKRGTEEEAAAIVVDGARKATGGRARTRVLMTMAVFFSLYGAIAGRLVYLGILEPEQGSGPGTRVTANRPDIVDRNGEVLATDIKTASLFAEPRRIVDADEVIEKLSTVLPDIEVEQTYHKLKSGAGFVWLKRQLTPRQQSEIMALGIPGIGFRTEKRRFYPGGPTASHILGLTNIDNQGISGLEKYIDDQGLADLQATGLATDLEPVRLSVDIRVQHIVRDELARAMEKYHAIAAGAVVLNAKTGEVVAMASLPDYDPNNPFNAHEKDRLNRMSGGVYEMGSTIKSFTTAMALDSGKVTLASTFDATRPITIGRQTIRDFHGKGRVLTVPEVFIYSSNIGSAREADVVGIEGHRDFLKRIGLLDRLQTELPEVARPTEPRVWKKVHSITISFGHGMSTTPSADGGGGRSADERRQADAADLPAAQPGAGRYGRRAGDQGEDQRGHALPLPAERREGLGQAGRGAGLPRRRQDRHGREGGQWPLRVRQALQRLPCGVPDGRPAIYRAQRHRRAEAGKAGHGGHIRPQCRADRRQYYPPFRPTSWREA
jgi:cell division protein FtsI (penicillin-binding protein 3)